MSNYWDYLDYLEIDLFDEITYIDGEIANGYYADQYGNESWYKDGLYHRIDGPAAVYNDRSRHWLQNGEYYRENDLPHIENHNGINYWLIEDRSYEDFEKYKADLNKYILSKIML